MACLCFTPKLMLSTVFTSKAPQDSSGCIWHTSKSRLGRIMAGEEPKVDEMVSSSGKTDNEEDPVWVRREKLRKLQEEQGVDLPFPFYLAGSGIVAIAAIGSIFEFINKKPVFGVIQPDNPVWLPLLAFFALAGLPVSGALFFRAVESANKAAERSDEIDRQ